MQLLCPHCKISHAQQKMVYGQFSVLSSQTNSLNNLPYLPMIEDLRKHEGPGIQNWKPHVRKSLKTYLQLNSFFLIMLIVTLGCIIVTERIKAGMKQNNNLRILFKNLSKRHKRIQIFKNRDIQEDMNFLLPAILWNRPWEYIISLQTWWQGQKFFPVLNHNSKVMKLAI